MKFESIENLIVWQKARTFAVESINAFQSVKEEIIKDLLLRNVITIMNTIGEAYEKPTRKELIDELYNAK
jgi:four helix bundle protein